MYNVRRFLQESMYAFFAFSSLTTGVTEIHFRRFEPSAEARARAAAEGTTRAEDLIPIDRERTTIEPGGQARASAQRYYVVDSVEALNKFGADAWDRVVCVLTTGQVWQFRPYKWSEPRVLFHHGECLAGFTQAPDHFEPGGDGKSKASTCHGRTTHQTRKSRIGTSPNSR
jgi:hypothetical protein